jgi:hypothetical protein
MLMQLQFNDFADEARYAIHIRDCLAALGGHAAERRLLADPAGYPSLRADRRAPCEVPPWRYLPPRGRLNKTSASVVSPGMMKPARR